jgi:hypothetical protein
MFQWLKELFSPKTKGKPLTWEEEYLGNNQVRVTTTYKDGSTSRVVYQGISPEAAEELQKRNLIYAEQVLAEKAEQRKAKAKH